MRRIAVGGTVFSFGAVLDEYLKRDLGIVLAEKVTGS
ncbi:MAG: hypothetical protein BWX48_00743 [Verrucomicrobia bacterium ADurb.Bin006]|jgi:hypothetical protein|nr:MAG: hypothetical protein BWX48_00743 [Verrucomicrobia bacterium ADurb.Bin006]